MQQRSYIQSKMKFPIALVGILISLCASTISKRNYDVEIVSIAANSTDESKGKIDLRVERISRGETVLNGTWDWQYDIDDTTMLETIIYSSTSGSENDYKVLPYSIPSITFNEFLEKHYNEIIYANFRNCSNLAFFKNRLETPWKKATYTFNLCRPKGDGSPDVLPDGFYKIFVRINGEIEVILIAVFKVFRVFY